MQHLNTRALTSYPVFSERDRHFLGIGKHFWQMSAMGNGERKSSPQHEKRTWSRLARGTFKNPAGNKKKQRGRGAVLISRIGWGKIGTLPVSRSVRNLEIRFFLRTHFRSFLGKGEMHHQLRNKAGKGEAARHNRPASEIKSNKVDERRILRPGWLRQSIPRRARVNKHVKRTLWSRLSSSCVYSGPAFLDTRQDVFHQL